MTSQAREPVTDPDGVRWIGGSWIGGQVGGTAWLVTAFAAYVWQVPWLGLLFLAAFAGINALGFWIWRHRGRFRFFRAVQLMTVVCGGAALLALVALQFLAPENLKHDLIWLNGKPRWVGADRFEFRRDYLLLLVIFPALLALFEVQGRHARRRGPG